jgi:hypothetical protein
MKVSPCPNCGGNNLYRSRPFGAGGKASPNFLPGLGGLLEGGEVPPGHVSGLWTHKILCES